MDITPERKSFYKFVNTVFWISVASFTASMAAFLLMGLLEDGQLILEGNALYTGRLIVNKLMLIELWIVGPTSLISLILHPKWWAKGISLLLFIYIAFSVWAMCSS